MAPLTYSVGELDLREGMAVAVRLGPRKLCGGIVRSLHDRKPAFATRPVEGVLYGVPLLSEKQMRFWEWVSSYYMCTLGEVMAAALPTLLRPEGFSTAEFERRGFRPSTVRYVRLHPSLSTMEELNGALEKLRRRAKKQYAALLTLAEALGDGVFTERLPRAEWTADSVTIGALEDKRYITIEEERASPQDVPVLASPLPRLSSAQQEALEQIERSARPTVLLHGVTGSGKTEIFINLAARELQAGRSVLYLLPEIPVSWQLIERLGEVFGERLVAYHSKFPPRRRAEIFMRLSAEDEQARIVVGTRQAVFLPTPRLGTVIVDEEHDTSFKQESPPPRFHARDSALVLASLHGARTILGSATPSLESWQNALGGKYTLVSLDERYGGVPMPRIVISDTLHAARRGERDSHFNKLLTDRLGALLDARGQAIIFQNRRGFSPYVECGACAWVARCPDCNVSLTLHKAQGRLRCHYCGYNVITPHVCPSCHNGELLPRGYGTEKIEEELARIFPAAAIERLDGDSTASPTAAKGIIGRFYQGQTDILVGTQMVTKGFDFSGVRLVGVVNADNMLNYPDFRASERAFGMLTQAAGRAGRRDEQGEVIIQSTQPEHPVLAQVAAGDYASMAAGQLAERRAFFYPPFCRLISLKIRHKDVALTESAANALAAALRPVFGRRLLGPEAPTVDRVQGEHIRTLLLKIEREKSFAEAKLLLSRHIEAIKTHPEYKKANISVDVDPL
jgi:primosomal protein N' (replication factor Y)